MRRAAKLFEQVLGWDNLQLACAKALRGKRAKTDARAFVERLDENLQWLGDELRSGRVQVGECLQFTVFDPKQRTITAPSFRERVLHHAIMNVCEPVFERFLISDTFACRKGKGRLACVARALEFARQYPFFLKMDVRKYFESIPHEILVCKLNRLFKDPRLLLLWERIIDSHHQRPGFGLPIGSLTSQHFANFYLSFLDRFVKEGLHAHGYVRYMDDFVIWGTTSRGLADVRGEITGFVRGELGLIPKENAVINRTALGMDFLGVRVFPDHLRLARRSKVRYVRKLRRYERAFLEGRLTERDLQRRGEALTAFLRTPGLRTWRFRRRVLEMALVGGHRASTACSAAAAGTTTARTAGRRTATGTTPATATTTGASASP
jgi:RNA-directed DNA polymerase